MLLRNYARRRPSSPLASVVLNSVPRDSPTNRNMGVLLVILTTLPVVIGVLLGCLRRERRHEEDL